MNTKPVGDEPGRESSPKDGEAPEVLDPAAERVRRKLVRFMGINLAILFAAVMAVVLAFVYKSMSPPEPSETSIAAETITGKLLLAPGARLVSHSIAGDRLSLHLRNEDGSQEILIYQLKGPHLIARYALGD